MSTGADRYRGKPLLILLENLVLHSVGALDGDRYEALSRMEPKLRQTFSREGSWTTILKEELRLPPDFEARVRELWENNAAAHRGAGLDPVAFARAFVDANYSAFLA